MTIIPMLLEMMRIEYRNVKYRHIFLKRKKQLGYRNKSDLSNGKKNWCYVSVYIDIYLSTNKSKK